MNEKDRVFMLKNQFEFIDVIGKGGYGVIYKIFDPRYHEFFALKKIPKSKFANEEVANMIEIESNSIVSLYKYYNYEEYVYLLMEFCPDSINNFIMRSQKKIEQPAQDKIYSFAIGVAKALSECHKMNITHGDIKPSNFLIDRYGRVKICDFGLSHKQTTENFELYSGTVLFLAPEILNKKPYNGYKADVWSLGVTLYMIATNGMSPWPITTMSEMVSGIKSGFYDETIIENQCLRKMIHRCLSINPQNRPSAEDVVTYLDSHRSISIPLAIKSNSAKNESKRIFKPFMTSSHLPIGMQSRLTSGIFTHQRRNSNIC